MSDEGMELVQGSTYVVHSVGSEKEPLVTSGVFTGYAYLSKDDVGLCIRMDDTHAESSGKTRIVPLATVLAIDVVQQKPANARRSDADAVTRYFS
jgi:hypothetical protein